MGRLGFLVVLVAAVAVVMPASGVAAKPVFMSHENFTDTFDDDICGIAGTSVVRGVDNFAAFADNTVRENFEVTQVFTATASGKSIVIHVAQDFTGNDEPIVNPDGTITFVGTFKGLPELIKIEHGPVLSRDAGQVTIIRTFDPTTFDLLDQVVVGEKGPHPDLDSGFEVFCNVLVPALT
jgi:hypothetical protein